jgi:hypothetical protein
LLSHSLLLRSFPSLTVPGAVATLVDESDDDSDSSVGDGDADSSSDDEEEDARRLASSLLAQQMCAPKKTEVTHAPSTRRESIKRRLRDAARAAVHQKRTEQFGDYLKKTPLSASASNDADSGSSRATPKLESNHSWAGLLSTAAVVSNRHKRHLVTRDKRRRRKGRAINKRASSGVGLVGSTSALVAFICVLFSLGSVSVLVTLFFVLCTLRTQISRSMCNLTLQDIVDADVVPSTMKPWDRFHKARTALLTVRDGGDAKDGANDGGNDGTALKPAAPNRQHTSLAGSDVSQFLVGLIKKKKKSTGVFDPTCVASTVEAVMREKTFSSLPLSEAITENAALSEGSPNAATDIGVGVGEKATAHPSLTSSSSLLSSAVSSSASSSSAASSSSSSAASAVAAKTLRRKKDRPSGKVAEAAKMRPQKQLPQRSFLGDGNKKVLLQRPLLSNGDNAIPNGGRNRNRKGAVTGGDIDRGDANANRVKSATTSTSTSASAATSSLVSQSLTRPATSGSGRRGRVHPLQTKEQSSAPPRCSSASAPAPVNKYNASERARGARENAGNVDVDAAAAARAQLPLQTHLTMALPPSIPSHKVLSAAAAVRAAHPNAARVETTRGSGGGGGGNNNFTNNNSSDDAVRTVVRVAGASSVSPTHTIDTGTGRPLVHPLEHNPFDDFSSDDCEL